MYFTLVKNSKQQSGIALLSVLGVMAVISIVISGLAYRQQLSTNLQGYSLQKGTAFLTALSVEEIAGAMLLSKDPALAQKNYDFYDEDWAKPEVGLIIGGVNVSFMIFDAQSLMNINNINAARGADRSVARRIIRRLLNRYGNSYNDINDWISPRRLLAKDRFYLAAPQQFSSYRIANAEMVALDELRLIANLRKRKDLEESMHIFSNYFSFFPINRQFVKINVNTASEDLLGMLLPYFGARGNVASFIDRRPFHHVNSFCSLIRNRRGDCRRMFTHKSDYYSVFMRIAAGDTIVQAHSLLKREKENIRTIARNMKSL